MPNHDDPRLSEAHARIAALPKYKQHEAKRRLSRSYSVPDRCVRDDECIREGDEIVWPDGERWPTRPTAEVEVQAAAVMEWLRSLPISKRTLSAEERSGFARLEERARTAEYPPKTPACISLLLLLRELPLSEEQKDQLWDLFRGAVNDALKKAGVECNTLWSLKR